MSPRGHRFLHMRGAVLPIGVCPSLLIGREGRMMPAPQKVTYGSNGEA